MYTYIQIIQFYSSVFPLFTPQNKHARISFNAQNDQWVNAHLFVKKLKFACGLGFAGRWGRQAYTTAAMQLR